MILHRCSSMLNSCKLSSPPKLLLSHLKKYSSLPFLYNSSSPLLPSSSSCSPLRIRFLLLNLNQQQPLRPGRTRAFTAVAADVDGKESTDTFFAEEGVSWNSVGISDDRLSRSLSTVGIDRPSLVQAACIPPILSGKDVVIAAETGSGKTYAYLVPLFEQVFSAVNDFENTHGQGFSLPGNITLVLCPNVMLCEQVVRMANGLCGDDGKPLLSVAAVCGRQGWPITIPDIIVSTPAALLNNLRSIDPERRRRSDFIRGVKYVVFDEADLLLCGSFQNQVIRLIDMLRFDEKQLSRMKKSMPEGSVELDSDTLLQFDSEDEENLQAEVMSEVGESLEGADDVEDVPEEMESSSFKRKDWRRERKIYQRSKQYIFVAATLPVNGKKTAGGILKRMFPDADWVSGVYLHCHNPRLEQQWVEVTIEKQVDALIDAVNQGVRSKVVDPSSGVRRTIVFANTVEAVQAVAKILQGAGIECFCYHSDSSLEERAQTLVDFQQKGGILVCTDAASRGLDISNVSHVIQADFASSALDFLHRVGRTARAGQYGLVTSLYTESNKDLVGAIREAWKLGQPVEMAFSRKRSFRKKLKKRVAANRVGDTSMLKERVLA